MENRITVREAITEIEIALSGSNFTITTNVIFFLIL